MIKYIKINDSAIQTSEKHKDGSFTSGIIKKVDDKWMYGSEEVDISSLNIEQDNKNGSAS